MRVPESRTWRKFDALVKKKVYMCENVLRLLIINSDFRTGNPTLRENTAYEHFYEGLRRKYIVSCEVGSCCLKLFCWYVRYVCEHVLHLLINSEFRTGNLWPYSRIVFVKTLHRGISTKAYVENIL